MSKVFFTSDLHFQHSNILKFTKPRPFSTIEEHDEALITNWNSVVKDNDTVYVLGDVALKYDPKLLTEQLLRLKGKKHLILGNHDIAKVQAKYLNMGIWESISDYRTIKLFGNDGRLYECILFHYPVLEYNHAFNTTTNNKIGRPIHMYGHIHNMNNYDSIYKQLGFRAVHVGLDTSDKYPNTKPYTPIEFDNILLYLENS